MRNQTITKVLKKVEIESKEYSLGFSRLTSLPKRVRKNINLACIMRGENNDNSFKKYLGEMTKKEFINYLKLA